MDHTLFYIKGGVTAGTFSERFTLSDAFGFINGTVDSARVGWTAGAGLEYTFLTNWSAKVEYNYLDFGTKRETIPGLTVGGATVGFNHDIDYSLHLVKAGINYKFSGGYR